MEGLSRAWRKATFLIRGLNPNSIRLNFFHLRKEPSHQEIPRLLYIPDDR